MNKKTLEKFIILLKKYNLKKIKYKNKTFFIEINNENTNPEKTYQKEKENKNEIKKIKSPLAGIFYTTSAPNKPPFVKRGDLIKKGDIICIIEAMKMLHNIKSKYPGIIEKILHKNSTPVEFGQDLFLIKNV